MFADPGITLWSPLAPAHAPPDDGGHRDPIGAGASMAHINVNALPARASPPGQSCVAVMHKTVAWHWLLARRNWRWPSRTRRTPPVRWRMQSRQMHPRSASASPLGVDVCFLSMPALAGGAALLALPARSVACTNGKTAYAPAQSRSTAMVSPGAASTQTNLITAAAWLADIARWGLRMLRCAVRCLQLASLALPPLIWLPVHLTLRCSATATQCDDETQLERSVGSSSSLMVRLLCNALERAGPTAIKLGQWASTRPDLFAPELCNHFSTRLHAAVSPHSASHSRHALEAILNPAGLALTDVFEHLDFDTPPLGSGCVAQVHGATLRADVARRAWAHACGAVQAQQPNGEGWQDHSRRVVVKILHPGVAESVALDMMLLEAGASVVTHWISLLPMLDWLRVLRLPELTSEFKTHLLSQLDLRTECENLLEFRQNFAGRMGCRTTDEAVFPTPLAVLPQQTIETGDDDIARRNKDMRWCPATATVLVESLEQGVGLDRWLVQDSQVQWHSCESATGETLAIQASEQRHEYDLQQRAQLRRQLAESGVVAFFQMVLVDNFVHADLHPGNILLRCQSHDSRQGIATAKESHSSDMPKVARNEVPSLVFLDAGLVVRLSENEKRNFCDLFLAVARGQGTKAGELIIDRSPGGRDGVKRNGGDPDRFVRAIAAVVEDVAARKFHLGSVAIGPVLLSVLSAVRLDRVPLDPAFGNLVSAIVVLEGIGRQLHPGLDLFGVAVPMLAKHAVRQMTAGT